MLTKLPIGILKRIVGGILDIYCKHDIHQSPPVAMISNVNESDPKT